MVNKAISLWQPWAGLISLGLKQVETRHWGTQYRGNLIICSAQKTNRDLENLYYDTFWYPLRNKRELPRYCDLYFGYAVAQCNLTNCIIMTEEFINSQTELERAAGDWEVGRFAWILTDIRPIDPPFEVKGRQGLFNL
ncbi:ASCH domain-containing protein [Cylindrospermum sp. FACHB-282]|uniref:ASCH domain-containing protein n=1 Tax=Cylindrospermum sp. FACHB-282 TaxID=2692794 RepID=UPI001689EFB3|nr:ASCH domain-containing protein [Cylindrospermum sp. FACHB-282]MBD2388874.1 ASCH domain-containing protein [Cylindrospermum sp. FACHB-282]